MSKIDGIGGGMDGGMDGGMLAGIPLIDRSAPAGGGPSMQTVPMDGVLAEGGREKEDEFLMFSAAEYPAAAWDPHLRAQVILAEFSSTQWRDQTLERWKDADVQSDIEELLKLRALRSGRIWEIVAQAQDIELHWKDMLGVGPSGRANTAALIASAVAIGHMVGMYWKDVFQRARPVQLFPALMPAIITPSHPSYPSNHSFQSYLVAHAVLSIFKGTGAAAVMKPQLFQLAARIGRNREIAGVHFPGDTSAGEALAKKIEPLMTGLRSFEKLRQAAVAEWTGLVVGEHPGNVNPGPAFADVVATRVVQLLRKSDAKKNGAARGATAPSS